MNSLPRALFFLLTFGILFSMSTSLQLRAAPIGGLKKHQESDSTSDPVNNSKMTTVLDTGELDSEPDESLVHEKQLRDRLICVAIVGVAVICLLGILFAYLRMEYISRGFYSGRLQLISIGAGLLVLTACYFAWRHFIG